MQKTVEKIFETVFSDSRIMNVRVAPKLDKAYRFALRIRGNKKKLRYVKNQNKERLLRGEARVQKTLR